MATTDELGYYKPDSGEISWLTQLNSNADEIEEDLLKVAQSHLSCAYVGLASDVPGTNPPPAGSLWFHETGAAGHVGGDTIWKLWSYKQGPGAYHEDYAAGSWRELFRVDRTQTPPRLRLRLHSVDAAGDADDSDVTRVNQLTIPTYNDRSAYPATFKEEGALLKDGTNIYVYDEGEADWLLLNCTLDAVDDHGALTGLADDDHTQYLRVDGTRDLTGHMDVTEGKRIDGVDVGAAILDGRNWFMHSCIAVAYTAVRDIAWHGDTEYAAAEGEIGGNIYKFDRESDWTLDCALYADASTRAGHASALETFEEYLYVGTDDGLIFRRDQSANGVSAWTLECALVDWQDTYSGARVRDFVVHDDNLWVVGADSAGKAGVWRRPAGVASSWSFSCSIQDITTPYALETHIGKLFVSGVNRIYSYDGSVWSDEHGTDTIQYRSLNRFHGALYAAAVTGDMATTTVLKLGVSGSLYTDHTEALGAAPSDLEVYDDDLWLSSSNETLLHLPDGKSLWDSVLLCSLTTVNGMRAVRGELQVFGVISGSQYNYFEAYQRPMWPALKRVAAEALKGDGTSLISHELAAADGAKIDNVPLKDMLLKGSSAFRPLHQPPFAQWGDDSTTWELTTTQHFIDGVATEHGLFVVVADTGVGTGVLHILKYDGRSWTEAHTKAASDKIQNGKCITVWGGVIVVGWAGSTNGSGGICYSRDGGATWTNLDADGGIDCFCTGFGGGFGAYGLICIEHQNADGTNAACRSVLNLASGTVQMSAFHPGHMEGGWVFNSGEIPCGAATTRSHMAVATDERVIVRYADGLSSSPRDTYNHDSKGTLSDVIAYQGHLWFLVHDSGNTYLKMWDTQTEDLGGYGLNGTFATLDRGYTRLIIFGAQLLVFGAGGSGMNIYASDGFVANRVWQADMGLLNSRSHPVTWASTLFIQPWQGSALPGQVYSYTESVNHTLRLFMLQFHDGRLSVGTTS